MGRSSSRAGHLSKATRYQNAALEYYLGLTNSAYLHYGYWDPLPTSAEELTISKLRTAQEAYATRLFSFIPPETKTILDVGCGTGGNSAALLSRGFTVEGLAPDEFQQEKFLQQTQGQAPFHLTTFEAFQSDSNYQLILFSESSQYIPINEIASGAARLLLPGGYLLVADMLRVDPDYSEGIFSNCHVAAELHATLSQTGFSLVSAEDISAQIVPTLDLGIEQFRTFGLTTITYLGNLVAIAVPPLHALLSRLLGSRFKKLVEEGLEARAIFERHLCYEIQLWQLGRAPVEVDSSSSS